MQIEDLKGALAEANGRIKDLGLENAKLRELLKAAECANEDLKAELDALVGAASQRHGAFDDELVQLQEQADALDAELKDRDADLELAAEEVAKVCAAAVTFPSSVDNRVLFYFVLLVLSHSLAFFHRLLRILQRQTRL